CVCGVGARVVCYGVLGGACGSVVYCLSLHDALPIFLEQVVNGVVFFQGGLFPFSNGYLFSMLANNHTLCHPKTLDSEHQTPLQQVSDMFDGMLSKMDIFSVQYLVHDQ